MSPRRSAGCGPGASMSRAESSRPRESRTPRKSPPSLQRSRMRMYDLPDARGHFGPYGGVFVAETLTHALDELRDAYESARADAALDRKSTRLNSSHGYISYAVFCLKKKKKQTASIASERNHTDR